VTANKEAGLFGDLAGSEAEMVRTVLAGEEFDPDRAGSGPVLRAQVLRDLLLDKKLPPRGVRLRNVTITGQLNLQSATVRRPLQLTVCNFDSGPLILDYAKVGLLLLHRCCLPGLRGDTLVATEGIELTGSRFFGPVLLTDARIQGHLRCTDAKLDKVITDPSEIAEYGGRYALICDGMEVRGDVRLDGAFRAAGVLLSGAHIGGTLDCTGATLTAVPPKGSEKNYSLRGSGLTTDGDVIFDKCVTEQGGIRLSDADIAGELLCHGTRLNGADKSGIALRANDLKVGSNVFFIEEFTSDGGRLSMKQAVIGGDLRIEPRRLGQDSRGVALDAAGTQVAQRLIWCPAEPVRGKVILERTAAGQLEDCWTGEDDRRRPNGYWPADGMLRIDGLTYTSIRSVPYDEKIGVDERLEWIRGQYRAKGTGSPASPASAAVLAQTPDEDPSDPWRFATQPYRQLANFYLGAGRDADARTVAIAQRRDLRGYGRISGPAKIGNWLLDNTIRYGYRTWHAAIALAVLFVAVAAFFWTGRSYGVVIAAQPPPGVTVQATVCTPDYPCFNAVGYTADTVIPIINVHQADFWVPNAHASWPWDWSPGVTYVGTALGWLFVTLAVAGYTGLARNASSP